MESHEHPYQAPVPFGDVSAIVPMDDDEVSIFDTPGGASELSDIEKQRASLQSYLDALPYECESVENMQEQLENIIGKMYICAKAKNWLLLSTWDGMLQWYIASLFLWPYLI